MLRLVAIIYFVFTSALHAATVVVDNNITFVFGTPDFTGANAHFGVSKYVEHGPGTSCTLTDTGCFTGIDFKYENQTISANRINLDEQSDWFLTKVGDTFSAASINAGQFPVIFNASPLGGGPVVVGPGDFYLGVRTGVGFESNPSRPNRTAYGWVHLHPENGVLAMVENVMSYDSHGIIVGTTTVVPEPSTFASLVLGMFLLAATCSRSVAISTHPNAPLRESA